jgi:hypothetical protein
MEPENAMTTPNITPDQLAPWKAQWAQAIAEEDRQHRHFMMFELACTALPAIIAAYERVEQERDDAVKEGLRLTLRVKEVERVRDALRLRVKSLI